ncbi:hypothetical protein Acr_09g0008740 [Actinidia rufa]|uniref:Uncharacterized protein n=1 Tax=Actinidia rufa TaxID=165716 RepID=A0A7J0F6V1_9ERIC|nr:hypothetical protein Acr_09g0008740 [Actinidia rufa]
MLLCAEGAGSEGYVFGGSAMVLVRAPRVPRDLTESGLELVGCESKTVRDEPSLSHRRVTEAISAANEEADIIRQCIEHRVCSKCGHDEMSAHGLWTKLKEDVPEEDISEQNLNEKACLKLQRGTTVQNKRASSRGHKKGQKKRPEKRSQERRSQKVKKRASADEELDWISDSGNAYHLCRDREVFSTHVHARDLYGWRTTRRRVVGKRTVRFRMADGRSMKSFQGKHEMLQEEGRLKGYTDWREVSRQEELLSDIGPVVLARRIDEESNRCTEAHIASAGIPEGLQDVHGEAQRRETESMYSDKRDVTETSLFRFRYVMVISPVVHTMEERWSHDDLQSDVLCSAPQWGGARHLSEKVQTLRFGSAFTSVEVELPVKEGVARERREAEQKYNPWGLPGAHSMLLCAEEAGSEGYVFGGSAMVLVRAPRAPRDLTESGLELLHLLVSGQTFARIPKHLLALLYHSGSFKYILLISLRLLCVPLYIGCFPRPFFSLVPLGLCRTTAPLVWTLPSSRYNPSVFLPLAAFHVSLENSECSSTSFKALSLQILHLNETCLTPVTFMDLPSAMRNRTVPLPTTLRRVVRHPYKSLACHMCRETLSVSAQVVSIS